MDFYNGLRGISINIFLGFLCLQMTKLAPPSESEHEASVFFT